MSIQKQVVLVLTGVFALYLAIYIGIHFLVVIPGVRSIEEEEALKDMKNAEAAIGREISHLESICRDWASWDEMYSFVVSMTPGFIRSNLNTETMDNIHVDCLYILLKDGSIVWTYTGRPGDTRSGPPGFMENRKVLLEMLMSNNVNGNPSADAGLAGLVNTGVVPLAISVRPVLTSKGTGPVRGYLVMGRFFDSEIIRELNEQTNTDFSIDGMGTPGMVEPPDQGNMGKGGSHIIREGDSLVVHGTVPDIFGKTNFRLVLRAEGKITKGQYRMMNLGMIVGLVMGLFATFVILLFVRHMVISPVRDLTEQIVKIEKDGDLAVRAKGGRNDEIGALAREFNDMLDQLARARADLLDANTELKHIAVIDGLTGIANRRRFDEVFDIEWRRGRRENNPLSLLMCDIDNFKLYNDTYGHQAGDSCLKAVADAIASGVRRPADLPARYGGEEFAVILPNTGTDGARHLGELVRKAVSELSVAHAGTAAGVVTISVGVATVEPDRDMEPAMLVAAADDALYRAKGGGRDRVVFGECRTTEEE